MKILCLFFLIFIFSACETQQVSSGELEKIASDFNQKGARMIDSETRIDGIEIRNGNTIIYKYTLINLLTKNVDTLAFRNELRPGIISVIKISPEMQKLRDQNTEFEYAYQDKERKFIYTFKIHPADYK